MKSKEHNFRLCQNVMPLSPVEIYQTAILFKEMEKATFDGSHF